jgi:hypothetical protein
VSRRAILLVAPLATLLLLLPTLWERPGALTGGDISAHVQFARGVLDSVRAGSLFPRWLADVNYGFGGPVFIFYPIASYYLAALGIWLAGGVVVPGFGIAFAIGGLACALSFYFASRSLVGPLAACFGAFLYTLTPYHAWDLHAGYYAEYVAYAWLPLIWWSARRVLDDETPAARQAVPLALGGALLVVTHLPTTMTMAVAMAPYVAIRLPLAGQAGKRLGIFFLAAGLSLLCSAAYLIPMQLERGWVDTAYVTEVSFGDYRKWLTPLGGVLQLPWANALEGALLLALTAVYGFVVCLRSARQEESGRSGAGIRSEAIAMGSLLLLSVFLQLTISQPLWRVIPELPQIQFPWRFNSPQALGCCVLVVLGLRPGDGGRSSLRRFLVAGVLALPAVALTFFLRSVTEHWFDQRTLDESVRIRNRRSPEFVPRPVPRDAGLTTLDGALLPLALWAREGGRHEVRSWSPERRELVVSTSQPNRLEIRTFFYPGWRARLNGRDVPLDPPIAPLYLLAVVVPPGEDQRLVFAFGTTPLRTGSAALSAAGLLGALFLAMRRGRRA